ncbi:MAG: thiamine phosphate synthase [Clostridia bacterium]|nr:thiamine phosphate synthase [Clostridia bacterium]
MSKQLFSQPLLYLIATKTLVPGRSLVDTVAEAIRGGVDVVQLREKDMLKGQVIALAKEMSSIVKQKGKLLLINHHLEAALEAGADGVHLGRKGPTIREAREALGPGAIIGASVHDLEEARNAVEEGADYLLVSHIFPTDSKPGAPPKGLELLQRVLYNSSIPVIALGGINRNNIQLVAEAGCPRAAVMSAILTAENPRETAKSLKEMLL